MTDELEQLRRAKIAHLDSLLAEIDRDWKRIPKLWWLSVFALPIAYFEGIGWGVVEVLFVASLVAVVMYILGVRRVEYTRDRGDIERDLAAARRSDATRDASKH